MPTVRTSLSDVLQEHIKFAFLTENYLAVGLISFVKWRCELKNE